MPERFKHIAILVAGIFLFPVAYLPWHHAQHHSHNAHSQEAHNHEAHSHESYSHHCDHSHPQHAAEDHSTANPETAILQSFEHCYICDYEFAMKDLPGAMELEQDPLQYQELLTIETSSQYNSETSWEIHPRAPPVA